MISARGAAKTRFEDNVEAGRLSIKMLQKSELS